MQKRLVNGNSLIMFVSSKTTTDIQYDLFGSPNDLDMISDVDLSLSWSQNICFDASWRGKHNGGDNLCLSRRSVYVWVQLGSPTGRIVYVYKGAEIWTKLRWACGQVLLLGFLSAGLGVSMWQALEKRQHVCLGSARKYSLLNPIYLRNDPGRRWPLTSGRPKYARYAACLLTTSNKMNGQVNKHMVYG